MSSKMMMNCDMQYQVYSRVDDGESIYLEIDSPDYFEVDTSRLMVKIPLDKWVELTEDFLEKHNRHFINNEQQMELDLC